MAGFKMHVTVSSLTGCGYAAAGVVYGFELDTSILAGALCGFSGMLPDLDSDYGTPLRETMSFAAAVVPMLLLHRFQALGLKHDEMALLGIGVYLFMRFGVTNMIRKYTVHRGMFHSIPAGLIFAGMTFIIVGNSFDLDVRYYKAGGVLAGFMSHLILDEIYSFEWKSGAWRVKKSFGTAVKLWGDDRWANFSTYIKLFAVVSMILGEPTVMQQLEARNPGLAQRYQQLQGQARGLTAGLTDTVRTQFSNVQTGTAGAQPTWGTFGGQSPLAQRAPASQPAFQQPNFPQAQSQARFPSIAPTNGAPTNLAPTSPPPANPFGQPPTQLAPGGSFDTAQRPQWSGQQ